MSAPYSSSISGDRPEEVERIHAARQALPPAPGLEFTEYSDGTRTVGGERPAPEPIPGFTGDLDAQRRAFGLVGAPPAGRADALARCVATFRRWLHMPDAGALLVTLATVAANRAAGDPVWLLLVGPPGGGKTEVLHPLSRLPDVHQAATLTEASLLSGTSRRDKAADAKGGLLRTIGERGIIVCKDFGSVLSMNRDARAAVLAALREVYDGAWTRHVGTDGGRTLSWSGKVGLVAGCTPAIDSHHAVIGSMGERFVLYRLPRTDPDAQARRALEHVGHESAMRAELGDAVAGLLAVADPARLSADAGPEATERLVALSTLAVRCRSAVERDGFSREVLLVPEAEAPARLALVLLRLLNGLRAVGADEAAAWRLVAKCALDSMPALRRRALAYLMARDAHATTAEVAARVLHPTKTTHRALEELAAHGIVARVVGGPGRPDAWGPTDWARGRWAAALALTGTETSGDARDGAATGTETSGDVRAGASQDGSAAPISLPLRIDDDISVPPPGVEGDYPASAWDADA